VALTVLTLVAGLAGCGLTANRHPQVIAADDLPAELRNPSASSSTTLAQSPATTSVAIYYLVQTDNLTRLVGVQREVKDRTRPRDRIVALLTPPTPAEQAAGLLTSIPTGTVLLDTKLSKDGQELTLDLSRSPFDIQGEELRNAFAQLVWTATALPGVQQVRFLVAGKEFRVPDEDGIEQPGAVSRKDYETLAPTAAPLVATTTTAPGTPTTTAGPGPTVTTTVATAAPPASG
jgi:spore germination protein GerM